MIQWLPSLKTCKLIFFILFLLPVRKDFFPMLITNSVSYNTNDNNANIINAL
jgi:hypothetical protein